MTASAQTLLLLLLSLPLMRLLSSGR